MLSRDRRTGPRRSLLNPLRNAGPITFPIVTTAPKCRRLHPPRLSFSISSLFNIFNIMFRAAPRLIAHPALRTAHLRSVAPARRFISTAPPTQKRRSFKSLVARLGIAGAIIYYYNTVDVFADEPRRTFIPVMIAAFASVEG